MTRFQLIFTGILVTLGIAGVIVFATFKNSGEKTAPRVVMWGTLKSEYVNTFLSEVMLKKKDTINVSYIEKRSDTFEDDLIAALARGAGPDMVLLPQDLIVKQLDKFYITPYENYSERTFKDSFIQEGELYLMPTGIVGFPFAVDPMVMYWNKDLFAAVDAALPPTSWTEFFGLVPKLTKKDETGNISQSLVAFGEVRNVTHAKDIISLLAIQAGTPIVTRGQQGNLASVFNTRNSSGLVPGEQAVSFFTEFSNPVKGSYSWNRALSNDRSSFIAGKLALYFGYASELVGIRDANPNLNFDVTVVPQTTATLAGTARKMTFGNMNGVAILKSSRNVGAAFTAAVNLTNTDAQTLWVEKSGYPPVRRDLLTKLPGDAYMATFYRSALVSNAWLDPDREGTDSVFMKLVENITSGRQRVSAAVTTASVEIDNFIR